MLMMINHPSLRMRLSLMPEPGAPTLCLALVVVASAALMGCGGLRADFIGGRTQNVCNESWPVCDTFVGCALGDADYVQGDFPGSVRFIVRVAEPSTVRAAVFLDGVSASGNETSFRFFEERCRSRITTTMTGRAFTADAQRVGAAVAEADLTGVGDHLVEVQSDSTASFVLKVEREIHRGQ